LLFRTSDDEERNNNYKNIFNIFDILAVPHAIIVT